MTINIAVVTSEGLILGCDSIASTTLYLVDPFSCHRETTDDDSFQISVTTADIVQHVTNTWDGVTKMFQLHGGTCPVAAVTAGLAKLNNRSMSSYANEFYSAHGGATPFEAPTFAEGFVTFAPATGASAPLESVEAVASEFLKFMRAQYDAHYADSNLPETYRDGPMFLVGGYDRTQHLPSLFRVNVQSNEVSTAYIPGRFGISWEGQSDAVERVLRGYDTQLARRVQDNVRSTMESARTAYAAAAAEIIQQTLAKSGLSLPEGFAVELPAVPEMKLGWGDFGLNLSVGDLPLQDAVNCASYLVGLQSGKAKFAYGVPTVGGRTHIGVITKADGFKMLDEPKLKHANVGYV